MQIESDSASGLQFGDSGLMYAFTTTSALRKWRITGRMINVDDPTEPEEEDPEIGKFLQINVEWC